MAHKKVRFILIVGDVDGLLSHLINEIEMIARYCGAKEEDFTKFKRLVQENLLKNETPVKLEHTFSFNENYIFNLIFYPTLDQLKSYFQNINSRIRQSKEEYSSNIAIMFSGHGYSCGSISLADGEFSGREFVQECLTKFVEGFVELDLKPMIISIALNCCHALAVSENMGIDTGIFFTELGTIKGGISSEEVGIEFDCGRMDEYSDVATLVLHITGGFRSIFEFELNGLKIAVWPFSVRELVPEGAIELWSKAFFSEEVRRKMESDKMVDLGTDLLPSLQLDSLSLAQSRKNKYKGEKQSIEEWKNYIKEMKKQYPTGTMPKWTKNEKPTFYIFQADVGDSILFSWKEWNILVDGSKLRKLPEIPFLEKVLQIKKLNLVVATHSDEDHIDGFYPFTFGFEFKQLGLTIEKFVCIGNDIESEQSPSLASHQASPSRSIDQFIQIQSRMKKLSECETSPVLGKTLFASSKDEYPRLHIIAIAPNEKNLKKMKSLTKLNLTKKEKNEIKNHDWTNKASIVILLVMRESEEKVQFALFTGDAYGSDIAAALESDIFKSALKTIDKQPSILDQFYPRRIPVNLAFLMIPHHGSEKNTPDVLLKAVKADNIAISTNGGGDSHHPHSKTLEHLKDYMEHNRKTKMWFNYDNEAINRAKTNCFEEAPQHVQSRLRGPDDGCNFAKVEIEFE